MSHSATIRKKVEIDTEVTIFEVVCRCDKKLDFDVATDRDGDLIITIDEHECIQEKE